MVVRNKDVICYLLMAMLTFGMVVDDGQNWVVRLIMGMCLFCL